MNFGNLNVGKTAISGTAAKEEDWGLDMTGNWSDFTQKTSGTTNLDQDRTQNKVNEITAITATTAGTKRVMLPKPATVRDLPGGSVVGENVRTFNLPMARGETRLFTLGTRQ